MHKNAKENLNKCTKLIMRVEKHLNLYKKGCINNTQDLGNKIETFPNKK